MKKIILLFLIVSLTTLAFGQIKLEAKLDSSHILIGDQTRVHLILTKNPSWNAEFPTDFKLGDSIEVLDISLVDTIGISPNLILQQHLTITTFDSGRVKIPSIPLTYKHPTSEAVQTIKTRPLFLNVATIAVTDSSTLSPIKTILEEAKTLEDYMAYIITAGVLAVAGLLIWFLVRRRKPDEEEVLPPVVRPPHEIALEKLFTLKKAELWQKGEVKAYQSQLTETVREYIEKRYEIPALESTTFEIVQFLKDKDISTDLKTRLREMLDIADLVKFAKAKPSQNIHSKLMEDAVRFVRETLYIPPVEEEGTV